MQKTTGIKSIGGTVGFALAGALSWLSFVSDRNASLPLGIFYAVLVFNTYFSIRLFSEIAPKGDRTQLVMDILLPAVYLLLAASLGSPNRFFFFNVLLFIIATAKYALLIDRTEHPRLIRRKILVDLSGVALAALVLGGGLAGYGTLSAWALAGVFLLANIVLFTTHPLYRGDSVSV